MAEKEANLLMTSKEAKPIRIRWQSFADVAQNRPYFTRLHQYLNEISSSETVVDVFGITPPDRDFGRLTEFRCSIICVHNIIEAEELGYDACVIGHFQDPGLYEGRASVKIPVIGAGEATMHFAAQVARRMALVTIDPVFEVWHLEQADRYGLRDRISHIVGLGMQPEDFAAAFAGDEDARARTIALFKEKTLPLVQDGAEVLIPAGLLPALLLGQEWDFKVGHAPVLNCAAIALKTAEMWVALHRLNGLQASRGPSFALAPARAIQDFKDLVEKGRKKADSERISE